MDHVHIQNAIRVYSAAYQALHDIQVDELSWMPGGDHKIGSIGEYYGRAYLEYLYPNEEIQAGNRTQKGWDFRVIDLDLKIQVKTSSAFSETGTLSPIHDGWDELYLIYLDRHFKPQGFWILRDNDILDGKERITSAKCLHPDNPKKGSKIFKGLDQQIDALKAALDRLSVCS